MNTRYSRDSSFGGGGRTITSQQHRRGQSLNLGRNGGGTEFSKNGNGNGNVMEEKLDLFSRNRRSLSVPSSDELSLDISYNSNVPMKLGRLSLGNLKLDKTSNMDDLLFSTDDGGKNDYDWLLTPPGTPLLSEATEPPRGSSFSRSASTNKASRLSVSQSENNHSSKPARSSSVTRPSISTVNHNTYSSNSYRSPSSILNTSSGSVTSLIRPSTPSARSNSASTARPSPSAVRSRPSTPLKSKPNLTTSPGEKTRGSLNARPSTPTSRPLIPANINLPTLRLNSRPSTPTRRSPTQGPVTSRSPSIGRVVPNGRPTSVTPASRGTSPSPRNRVPTQPVVPPDFPLTTPPNLRTTFSDRPVSTGRARPSTPGTVKGNLESNRRQSSSPVVTRGRVSEVSGKARTEYQKGPPSPESAMRRFVKPAAASAADSPGFGRTISKKSLDMALRHMDIRNGSGCTRPLSGYNRFPQSIRSANSRIQPSRSSNSPVSGSSNGDSPTSSTVAILDNGSYTEKSLEDLPAEDQFSLSAKFTGRDIYESSRYDAILLKEDVKNTNWLHSVDEQDMEFDHRFDPLPELFDPL